MATIKAVEAQELEQLNLLYGELMGQPANPAKLAETFGRIAGDDRYILLGAYVGGELLGSLMGIICQDLVGECRQFMVVENVVVSSRARRQGLGKQLMDRLEAMAHERDCSYIILVSGDKRKEAHVFYEALGYREEKVEGYRKHLVSH
ncbi:GNAT family N-acetyltransferase ['Paenibacillus yunnanensis' Narsing Rao et al. 2020]|uniref:GNAT family N-acetyltransferase n=1 Tax=Paenibacillus tengchongensis TaxID=2608684 RepID=UPI00124F6F6D|nr:GNAT family N-acetyltransferase [Paenibacillus tengchongensis]